MANKELGDQRQRIILSEEYGNRPDNILQAYFSCICIYTALPVPISVTMKL